MVGSLVGNFRRQKSTHRSVYANDKTRCSTIKRLPLGHRRKRGEIMMPDQAFLTSNEAAARARVTRQCLVRWCFLYPDLARRVVGRWRIDPTALDKLLAGDPGRRASAGFFGRDFGA